MLTPRAPTASLPVAPQRPLDGDPRRLRHVDWIVHVLPRRHPALSLDFDATARVSPHPDRNGTSCRARSGASGLFSTMLSQAYAPAGMAGAEWARAPIVVGGAGRSGAEAALESAVVLARTLGATDVVVLHAAEHAAVGNEREDWLRSWCDDLVGPNVVSAREVVEGEPARVLLSTADRLDAIAVCVGSHEHGQEPARHQLGSVVSELLRLAHRPVIVFPSGRAPSDLRSIVVGFDDSPASETALTWTGALAGKTGATGLAVAVAELEPLSVTVEGAERQISEAEQKAGDELAAALISVPGGADLASKVRYARPGMGQPGRTLLQEAETADLLVVGGKQRGTIVGTVVGSATRRCLLGAVCPVMVVPQSTDVHRSLTRA